LLLTGLSLVRVREAVETPHRHKHAGGSSSSVPSLSAPAGSGHVWVVRRPRLRNRWTTKSAGVRIWQVCSTPDHPEPPVKGS
jgi:hypothetical protein